MQAASVQVASRREDEDEAAGGGESDSDVRIDNMLACTTSTNMSDDFAHRGRELSTMPFYVYRMYVRRVRKPSRANASAP